MNKLMNIGAHTKQVDPKLVYRLGNKLDISLTIKSISYYDFK